MQSPIFFKKIKWNLSDIVSAYFYVFSLSFMACGFLYLLNIDKNDEIFQMILQLFSSLVFFAVAYITIRFKFNLSFKEIMGIDGKNWKNYLKAGLYGGFLLIVSTTIINIITVLLLGSSLSNPYESFSKEKFHLFSIIAVLVSPFVEEVFFRGFMQPIFVKKFGIISGILLTAVFFGISHAQYANYSTAMSSVIAIGIILGVLKENTKSIIPCILAHFINNLLAVLLTF